MRYSASEKLEIIRTVETSPLPVRRTLAQIGIPKSTFYTWLDGPCACARAVAARSSARVGRRIFRLQVHDDADAVLADRRDTPAPPRHARAAVVRRDRRLEAVAMAGRERAVQIAAVGDDPRLVQRRPELDPVVELAEHDRRRSRRTSARCRD